MHTASMQRCTEDCLACYRACIETSVHCLQKGGDHAEARHLQLMLDCAKLCQISADFMLCGSNLAARLCELCAETCETCAEDCERFKDEEMKRCAEICRRCAASCREMAGTQQRSSARAAR
jgi:hypothetical protein